MSDRYGLYMDFRGVNLLYGAFDLCKLRRVSETVWRYAS